MRAAFRMGVGALALAGALAGPGDRVLARSAPSPPDALPWAGGGSPALLLARRGHRRGPPAGEGLGPGEAAAIAREHAGGRVLRVRPRRPGAEAYQVKILLPGGRVRTVVVDGRTGEVLE